ncbi:MAG: molybdenum cofactor guanylyltransferase [Gammaproteobacteria bacterium]|nr:molybdenum cofactor guanylyltransferase [Gammaproteobacteria bacterium]
MNGQGTTLGLLAGGRATRLDGVDKAWLAKGGRPQVLRLAERVRGEVEDVLVSANRSPGRYAEHGLAAVPDRRPGLGPLGGLDALADACTTPWLLTLPVDLVSVNDCLLRSLRAAGGDGAWAEDDDGRQPLVALWKVSALRAALPDALASGDLAVQGLQARMAMSGVRFAGLRFGNLNTPADVAAAGFTIP